MLSPTPKYTCLCPRSQLPTRRKKHPPLPTKEFGERERPEEVCRLHPSLRAQLLGGSGTNTACVCRCPRCPRAGSLGNPRPRGSVRAKQVSRDSHLHIIKTPALISNSVIKRGPGARDEGEGGMKERVECGRSETGSGEKRRRAPPSESGRELAWLQGQAGFQFGEGTKGGKEAQSRRCGTHGFPS